MLEDGRPHLGIQNRVVQEQLHDVATEGEDGTEPFLLSLVCLVGGMFRTAQDPSHQLITDREGGINQLRVQTLQPTEQ